MESTDVDPGSLTAQFPVFRNDNRNYFVQVKSAKRFNYYLTLHTGQVAVVKLEKNENLRELKPAPEADTTDRALQIFSTTDLKRTSMAERVIQAIRQNQPIEKLRLDDAPVGRSNELIDPATLMKIVGEGALSVAKKSNKVEKSTEKSSRRSAVNSNVVSLKEICRSIDAEPRIVRRVLRGSKEFSKTEGRWEWPKDQSNKIAKLIQESMRKEEQK